MRSLILTVAIAAMAAYLAACWALRQNQLAKDEGANSDWGEARVG